MSKEPLRILLIDDDEEDYIITNDVLRGSGHRVTLDWVSTYAEALEEISSNRHDVYLLDYRLGSETGLDLIREASQRGCDRPIIFLTGQAAGGIDLDAIRAGASDYLVKGSINADSLWRSIRYSTERFRLLKQLKESSREQLELKAQFMSHVSHELRSPLTAMHQFVSLVHDGIAGNLNHDQSEYLGIALKNLEQLVKMIDDLLEATRNEAGKLSVQPQEMLIEEILEDSLAAFGPKLETKGIHLSGTLGPGLPPVHADPTRVRQVLSNLIDNAIKFTPGKGRIEVRAEIFPENQRYVRISVADTGCGISPDKHRAVFDQMYQDPQNVYRSREGLGLGLYICKGLVSRQGGRIWVESERGRGSTFHFTLPVFALNQVIQTVVSNCEENAFSLVTIEVRSGETSGGSEATAQTVNEIRDAVTRCIYPDKDVVLPRFRSWSPTQGVAILVGASEVGVKSLVDRIHRSLRGLPSAERDFLYSIEFETMNLIDEESNSSGAARTESSEEQIESVAAWIEEQMGRECAPVFARRT